MSDAKRAETARNLVGPILVIGASGFVGANLLRYLLEVRQDVYGTVYRGRSWRLADLPPNHIRYLNLLDVDRVVEVLDEIKPATIFDCAAYGGYSFQTDHQRIYHTDFLALVDMLELLSERKISAYVHAGSSSEYGLNCAAPEEHAASLPNSHYAVAKLSAANLLGYFGKVRGLPCLNLRLYSVYGPYEDSSRLIPAVVERGLEGKLPPFVSPDTARDFVYVDDVCDAFVRAATAISPSSFGASYNIGTGKRTRIRDVAELARREFGLDEEPSFGETGARPWDLPDWYANPGRAAEELGWRATTTLEQGLTRTRQWWEQLLRTHEFSALTARPLEAGAKMSITAIVACYKDAQAIPIMYRRLVDVFARLSIDYQIIFVNDNSPDDSLERIREISHRDPRVLGISHSRNFGSQAAFRSGMGMASREACVLLDGDLQDPPELIEQFVEKWREGFNVVYGRRIKRDMPALQGALYKAFYRVFHALSYVPIPKDAGDFSLIDQRAVRWLLKCGEHDTFLRGLRAYVGFRQTGVDYVRPERMFGRSTNNFWKNIGWAKKGIFSFSHAPLNLLSFLGTALLALALVLTVLTIGAKLMFPELAPKGVTTVLLATMFFGAINLFGIGILGEYLGKIIVEVKGRPEFIRSNTISGGRIHDLTGED